MSNFQIIEDPIERAKVFEIYIFLMSLENRSIINLTFLIQTLR